MAPANIKIPYAERGGELVHISAFDKGGLKPDCLCLVCKKSLIARIGKKRVPHFAHPPDVQPCNLETVLHQLGKRLLAQRIEQALTGAKPLRVRWECDECGEEYHTRNALKEITSYAVELPLGPVRPDVALCRRDDEAAAVFEIIVSHPPEPEALAFYKEKGIKVWQITLATVEDAERLAEPDEVLPVVAADNYCPLPPLPLCPDPSCHAHGQKMAFRYLRVPSVPCWSCGHPMKAAFVGHGRWGDDQGPEVFTPEEIVRARAEGVLLCDRRSHFAGKVVPANTCPRCRSHIGVFFYDEHMEAIQDSKALARLSYGCEVCNTFWPVGGPPPPPPVPPCSRCAQPLTARYFFLFEWRDPDGFHSKLPVVMFGRHQGETVGPLEFTHEELMAAAQHGANERGDQIELFYRTAGTIIRQRRPFPMLASWWCRNCQSVDEAAGKPPLKSADSK